MSSRGRKTKNGKSNLWDVYIDLLQDPSKVLVNRKRKASVDKGVDDQGAVTQKPKVKPKLKRKRESPADTDNEPDHHNDSEVDVGDDDKIHVQGVTQFMEGTTTVDVYFMYDSHYLYTINVEHDWENEAPPHHLIFYGMRQRVKSKEHWDRMCHLYLEDLQHNAKDRCVTWRNNNRVTQKMWQLYRILRVYKHAPERSKRIVKLQDGLSYRVRCDKRVSSLKVRTMCNLVLEPANHTRFNLKECWNSPPPPALSSSESDEDVESG